MCGAVAMRTRVNRYPVVDFGPLGPLVHNLPAVRGTPSKLVSPKSLGAH